MGFEDEISRLLDPKPSKNPPDQWVPFSPRFDQAVSAATREISRVLGALASRLPGSHVIEASGDSHDPAFYVTALRIPQLSEMGFTYPLRLYFIVIPIYHPSFRLRIARVVAIGRGTHVMSVGTFLRAWKEIGTGGNLIYEGDADPQAIRIAAEQGVLRFLLRRSKIIEWYQKGQHVGHTLVWPIDAQFHPPLCDSCLLPIEYGPRCPKCGAYRASYRSSG